MCFRRSKATDGLAIIPLFFSHPPRISEIELKSLGAEVHRIARGGETTFHGPGQIVMYPIINLRRLGIGARAYVEGLEDTIIASLRQFDIHAQVGSS